VLDTIVVLAGLEPRRLPVSDILEARKNQLVPLLANPERAAASGIFAENFFLDNRESDLIASARALFEDVGPIVRVGEMTPMNQLRGTFVLECERGNVEVFFTLSPETVPLVQQARLRRVAR